MHNIVNELNVNVYFKWLIFCYMTFNSIKKKKKTSIIPNIHSKHNLSLMSYSLGIN